MKQPVDTRAKRLGVFGESHDGQPGAERTEHEPKNQKAFEKTT